MVLLTHTHTHTHARTHALHWQSSPPSQPLLIDITRVFLFSRLPMHHPCACVCVQSVALPQSRSGWLEPDLMDFLCVSLPFFPLPSLPHFHCASVRACVCTLSAAGDHKPSSPRLPHTHTHTHTHTRIHILHPPHTHTHTWRCVDLEAGGKQETVFTEARPQ